MSWLSKLLHRLTPESALLRELADLAYHLARERYVSSILAEYDRDPDLSHLPLTQKRAAAEIALGVVRRKLLGA